MSVKVFEIESRDFLLGLLLVLDTLSGFEDGFEIVLVVVCLEQGVKVGFVDFVSD